jgi:poly(A) polymerase
LLRDNVFGSQAEDAARRDFTVNALYYDPTSETIVDYHHGVADLQQKTLRMIGDPKTRYREDPVRMLRAVRLAAKLGLSIDPEGAAADPRDGRSDRERAAVAPVRRDAQAAHLRARRALRHALREEGLHHGLLPLLDVILDQALGERFVMLALETTDRRVEEGKPISPASSLPPCSGIEVLAKWEPLKASGEPAIPSLFQAMDEVLDVQAEKLAITRRIAGDIKDIWALQPRFEQRSGKRPYGVLQQPRFKAGYDFLLLRVESGESRARGRRLVDGFSARQRRGRAAMLLPQAPGAAKKARRRRRPTADAGQNSSLPE